MNTKIIDGKKYNLTLSGNVSGTKINAQKTAKKMREMGYSARIVKSEKITGRIKNSKGETTKEFKTTRYDVFIRK